MHNAILVHLLMDDPENAIHLAAAAPTQAHGGLRFEVIWESRDPRRGYDRVWLAYPIAHASSHEQALRHARRLYAEDRARASLGPTVDFDAFTGWWN